jgi:hypothetical protein
MSLPEPARPLKHHLLPNPEADETFPATGMKLRCLCWQQRGIIDLPARVVPENVLGVDLADVGVHGSSSQSTL